MPNCFCTSDNGHEMALRGRFIDDCGKMWLEYCCRRCGEYEHEEFEKEEYEPDYSAV